MKTGNDSFTPETFFDSVNGFYRTAAIKTAIELNLFSAIGTSGATIESIVTRCNTSSRATRILCDYLVSIGFLCKRDDCYSMTNNMRFFLDRNSPGYVGGSIDFFLSDAIAEGFKDLTTTLRTGKTILSDEGVTAADHPQWVQFARSIAPMMSLPASLLAELVDRNPTEPVKVLDVAAGHGLFGIACALRNKQAQVTALDWTNVLNVAEENAKKADVAERFTWLPGDAFDVDFGNDFDIIIFANFLHHFEKKRCEEILAKARFALKKNGRAVILEFIADKDRISPSIAATFSMMMLATTSGGEVYTFPELENMLQNAGYHNSKLCSLSPALEKVVISYKDA